MFVFFRCYNFYEKGESMKVMELVNKYRKLSFENRAIFNTKVSIIFNATLAISKAIISIFTTVFFLIAGIVNLFIMLSKYVCYKGITKPEEKIFKKRNALVGSFLLIAGVMYAIYMGSMIFTDVSVMKYDMILGIVIACVSFIELGVAIFGCFRVVGKGHYYRNIKLINLCSALTAIVLTEVALTSAVAETDTRLLNGIFGLIVGFVIYLIACYIFVAPRISIVDREHNVYESINESNVINEEKIEIVLTDSKFYGNYTYVGVKEGNKINGHIIKGKSPIFSWNIYIKILIIVLSEILIFVYAGGALIHHFKDSTLIKKLDGIMLEKGYKKILMQDWEEEL